MALTATDRLVHASVSAKDYGATGAATSDRGSVLIIVLWVCLGLVALTLYFANSMSSELRAADNRTVEAEARQAVAGGTRYAGYLLSQLAANGAVPEIERYVCEAMPVGEAQFWWLGRDPEEVTTPTEPYFALVDESSKLNLNTATSGMLQGLPGMTAELADAIIAWRNGNSTAAIAGDFSNTYARMDPPRLNKGAPFESVDELRLVYGMTLDVLLGEDTNRNGLLDPNEDDGDASPPRDDQDGQLFGGILEHVTVWSRLPTRRSDGGQRINISTPQTRENLRNHLVRRGFEAGRATAIMEAIGDQQFTSVAEFMLESRMTADEFALIHTDLTDSSDPRRVNVNTASATVLACVLGIEPDLAATLVAYRVAHPETLTSMYWLRDAGLPAGILRSAGRYITDQSYQLSADVIGVGRKGRGYCRERVVFDLGTGVTTTPRIVFRQDLTAYGWALGRETRLSLRENNRL